MTTLDFISASIWATDSLIMDKSNGFTSAITFSNSAIDSRVKNATSKNTLDSDVVPCNSPMNARSLPDFSAARKNRRITKCSNK